MRVGDILVTGSPLGHAKFAAAIGRFEHSGIEEITESTPTTHMGLEIAKKGKSSRVHQKEYPNTRARDTLMEDVVRGALALSIEKSEKHSRGKLLAACCG